MTTQQLDRLLEPTRRKIKREQLEIQTLWFLCGLLFFIITSLVGFFLAIYFHPLV